VIDQLQLVFKAMPLTNAFQITIVSHLYAKYNLRFHNTYPSYSKLGCGYVINMSFHRGISQIFFGNRMIFYSKEMFFYLKYPLLVISRPFSVVV
jgi:hypothetical protein